jgi:hypothetical protein
VKCSILLYKGNGLHLFVVVVVVVVVVVIVFIVSKQIQLQVKTIGYRTCQILNNAPTMEQVNINYLNYTQN